MDEEEISTVEAAKRAKVTPQTIRNLIKRGKIKARPKSDEEGSPILVDAASLDRYLAVLRNLK